MDIDEYLQSDPHEIACLDNLEPHVYSKAQDYWTQVCPNCQEGLLEFIKGDPGQLTGLPENSYPPEPDEVKCGTCGESVDITEVDFQ